MRLCIVRLPLRAGVVLLYLGLKVPHIIAAAVAMPPPIPEPPIRALIQPCYGSRSGTAVWALDSRSGTADRAREHMEGAAEIDP